MTTPPSATAATAATSASAATAPARTAGPPSPGGRAARLRERRFLPLYVAIFLGAAVRAAHVLGGDFPLNDGGLFYRMTEEILAARFTLPTVTSYNGAALPFAYSPAAFYLAAAAHDALGVSLTELFRWLPFLVSCLTVVAFVPLARAVLRDERAAAVAVLAFALVPRSFLWLVMGGGLTRSVGLLCGIIALHQAHALYTRREWRFAAGAAAACALTVLSHLSTAHFIAWSVALLFVVFGRHRFGVAGSALVAAGTLALSAPWWGTVIVRLGVAPFLAAQSVSGSVFGDAAGRNDVLLHLARLNFDTTAAPLFPVVWLLGLLGAFVSLRPGRIFLPVWWVGTTIVDPRAGWTYATIPLALLAGIGAVEVLWPALRSNVAQRSRHWRALPAAVGGALVAFAAVTAALPVGGEMAALGSLGPADREAMRWVARSTAPTDRFLVVTGEQWSVDEVAEWFPVLAGRRSVATVQGTEWVPGFTRGQRQSDALQIACATADGRCLESWSDSAGRPFTHVYVARPSGGECCAPLAAALRRDPGYVVLHDGPGALVAARRAGARSALVPGAGEGSEPPPQALAGGR